MKIEYPIRINKGRERLEPGGDWTHLDPFTKGRTQILKVANYNTQANVLVTQLEKLKKYDPSLNWSDCAVLSRRHEELATIRAAFEYAGIPVAYVRQDLSLPIGRVREIRQFFAALKPLQNELRRARDLETLLTEVAGTNTLSQNTWWGLLAACLQAWHIETGNSELPLKQAIDSLWEDLIEQKRDRFIGRGVFLSTVHAAKGTEFDHVFVAGGHWTSKNREEEEEERRAYYVAMTRARKTLTLVHREDDPNPYYDELKNKLSGDQLVSLTPQIQKPIPASVLQRHYDIIGLRDVYLDYAGRMASSNPVHYQLGKLGVGDLVQLKISGSKLEVCTLAGHPVAVLSKEAKDRWSSSLQNIEKIKVIAMVERRADDSKDSDYSKLLKVDSWEVPVLEVVWS